MLSVQLIYMLIKVLAAFAFIYIIIPAKFIRFDREADGFMDRVFISLVNMVFVVILLVHLLVLAKLYEFISLALLLIVLLALIYRRQNKKGLPVLDGFKVFQLIPSLMEHADSERGFIKETADFLGQGLRNTARRWLTSLVTGIKDPGCLVPALLLLGAAWVRIQPTLLHASYTHIDPYVHLIWSKKLGFNDLYFGGIYPRGMHSFYSAMTTLSFIDTYWIVRFMGPIIGVLIVFSVYYFTARLTGSRTAGLLPLVIFGFINNPDFPTIMFRQTAGLTQEFAMVFMLPGLYFLILYLKDNKNKFLYLFLKCFTIILFTHTYAAMLLALWSTLLTGCWVIIKRPSWVSLGKIAGYSVLAAVIAFLPLGLGLLLGNHFHATSIEMVQIKTNYWQLLENLFVHPKETFLWTDNVYMILLWPAVLVVLLNLLKTKDANKSFIGLSIVVSVLAMYLMYRIPFINSTVKLPELLDKYRVGPFFALLLAPVYAFGLTALKELAAALISNFRSRALNYAGYGFKLAVYGLCIFLLIGSFPIHLFKGSEEYDAAAQQYLKIRKSFPKQDLTLVAPHEQYAQILGYGYHYQMYEFVRNFKAEEVQKPEFRFPIPTHHVFIYVEKRPLHYNKLIGTADAQKELEPVGADPFMQYYKNPQQRAVMEAKVMVLLNSFTRSHPKEVSIYYEDNNLKIYHIYQKDIQI